MYTNCPECGTVFRISTTELRVAEGYVRCGHCGATFNALATLADQLPPTVTLQQLTLPTESDPGAAVESATTALPAEPERPAAPPELQMAATYVPLPVSEDTLEFDIPEDKWSNFFAGDGPAQHSVPASAAEPDVASEAEAAPATHGEVGHAEVGQGIGSDTLDQAGLYRALASEARDPEQGDDADWQSLLTEVPDDEPSPEPVYVISEDAPRDVSAAPPLAPPLAPPPWESPPEEEAQPPAPLPADFTVDLPENLGTAPERVVPPEPQLRTADRPFLWTPPAAPETPRSGRGWAYTGGSALLALLLVTQVLHQQRDELATNPVLTEPLQRLYAVLGLPLWPAWDLQAYQVRNSEAVAERSSRGALDILARIAVVGDKPVGLPFVRVTLRDGRAQPLGSRVFRPSEYLGKTPRPREPVSPGTLIPVEISLKDPGRDALGFDVDVCVMSRREGMLCRADREPFSR